MLGRPKPGQPTILGKYKELSQAQSAWDHFMRKNNEYREQCLKDPSKKLGVLYFGLKMLDGDGNPVKLEFINKGEIK